MVLEYLAGTGPADDWMPEFAASLARLHALTGPADAGALPAWSGPSAADAESFLAFARALEVPVPPGLPDELAGLIGRLDPAPTMRCCTGIRAPATTCAPPRASASSTSSRRHWATAWSSWPTSASASRPAGAPCRRPARRSRRPSAAYRATWRNLTGTDVPGDLADACAGWLIRGDALVERAHRQSADHLARVPGEDFAWGYITARERLLHRLVVVAGLTRGHDRLHALGQLSTALAARLRGRWPTLRPLPAYSARPWYQTSPRAAAKLYPEHHAASGADWP